MKCVAMVLALMLSAVAAVPAQGTTLTLGGFTGNLGSTTAADLDQGFKVAASAMTYQVSLTASPYNNRATTVQIRADAATMGGGKSVGSISWQTGTLNLGGTWTTLTTSNVVVESRNLQGNGASWSNTLWFRVTTGWTTDPPAVYSVGVTLTLTVSAP